jgi:hypothetical protein
MSGRADLTSSRKVEELRPFLRGRRRKSPRDCSRPHSGSFSRRNSSSKDAFGKRVAYADTRVRALRRQRTHRILANALSLKAVLESCPWKKGADEIAARACMLDFRMRQLVTATPSRTTDARRR